MRHSPSYFYHAHHGSESGDRLVGLRSSLHVHDLYRTTIQNSPFEQSGGVISLIRFVWLRLDRGPKLESSMPMSSTSRSTARDSAQLNMPGFISGDDLVKESQLLRGPRLEMRAEVIFLVDGLQREISATSSTSYPENPPNIAWVLFGRARNLDPLLLWRATEPDRPSTGPAIVPNVMVRITSSSSNTLFESAEGLLVPAVAWAVALSNVHRRMSSALSTPMRDVDPGIPMSDISAGVGIGRTLRIRPLGLASRQRSSSVMRPPPSPPGGRT
ncbi:hypothetical protein BS47DRAFT_1482328 [Hydnum rufescens UP504]|uniref:Uncharacterized protein n=1 Tax=Hydnum rufescens UP504 TaxID=1448309 RepID=A0A9P6E191_9AGAM|nr:hypothetical protein BS47DRAFT_1482328 [Hydnum rufescens UP504]